MPFPEKSIRLAAIALAVPFTGLSLCGIAGVWLVDRRVEDVAGKALGFIGTGVDVVDAGVGRVEDLIATSLTEVRQASETIATVGAQAGANTPVLNALNERLESRLAPRIAQMQQVLAPVRDAVGTVGNAVSLLNSLPMAAERAPRLAAMDAVFTRLEELSADAAQLRGTLRTLAAAQKGEVTAETVATLNGLTQRISSRLGEVQANLQGVRADVTALQVRLDERRSRVLSVTNLLALLATLMLAWVIYTQVFVIRHHWTRVRPRTAKPASGGLTDQTDG